MSGSTDGAPLRVLVVDDEEAARRRLERLLSEEPDAEVVQSVEDGEAAVRAIRELQPDLALLDVRMPGLDGFDVLREIGEDRPPAVAFVTAYDEHAVKAFRERAVDYLLKPVDAGGLRETLERARERTDVERREDLSDALDALRRVSASGSERLLAAKGDREVVVEARQVRWIESAGNYARLHTGDDAWLLRRTLASLEESLDPDRFRRIHRSRIVNLDRVREIRSLPSGDARVVLDDGEELRMSRRYAADVRAALGAG